jgi:heme exporter protein C
MWFVVIAVMGISVFHSVRLLRLMDPDYDTQENPLVADDKAVESAKIGVLFNILGLATGIVWSRVTWGAALSDNDFKAWWGWDPIQVCAVISLLIYGAYFLLRMSFNEEVQRAKVAAVYNIFAFATLIPLYFILPKMLPGLHPTSADSEAGGGSFVMKGKLGGDFSLIFWPSIFGFILLAVWLYELRTRTVSIKRKLSEIEEGI